MIHVYYGDGPGKTTAAFGLAIRALGRGWRVAAAQFLKSDNSGERRIFEKISGATLLPAPSSLPFTFVMSEEERDRYRAFLGQVWRDILSLLNNQAVDMLILDEWGDAFEQGWFREADAQDLWLAAGHAEIVITTHQLPALLEDEADYLTKISKEKHPYDNGQPARKGIEY